MASFIGQIEIQNKINNHIKIQNNCVHIYRNMSMIGVWLDARKRSKV